MIQFHNEVLNAPNVLLASIDDQIISEFAEIISQPLVNEHFFTCKPSWNSDSEWISPNSLLCFQFFHDRFVRSAVAACVAPYLDLELNCRMYSGFFVRRSRCTQADFHLDWINTNNEAFTLITPITSNSKGFGLLYQREDESIGEYEYRIGEAIIFGDRFLHATKPGSSAEPVVLLSFTFGSDKMIHWPAIAQTGGNQGNIVRFPNGHFRIASLSNL